MSQNVTNDSKAPEGPPLKRPHKRLVVMFDVTGSTRQNMTNVSRMFEAIDDSLPDDYKPIVDSKVEDSTSFQDPGHPISTKIVPCKTCNQPKLASKEHEGDDSKAYSRAGVPCGSCQQLVVEPALQPDQKVKYIKGVGTTCKGLIGKLSAQAFGYGLSDKIMEGYIWLCNVYETGDEVFVFGFSRGAFAARSLVSLLHKCDGVLKRKQDSSTLKKTPNSSKPVSLEFHLENVDDKKAIKTAYDYYRAYVESPVQGPDESTEAKLNGVKSKEDKLKEAKKADHCDAMKKAFDNYLVTWNESTKHEYSITQELVQVKMLGVWDTVGALGFPETGHAIFDNHSWSRSQYQFHDEGLSRIVDNAYHALALDEEREAFNPTPWTSQTTFNKEVKQVWFVGSHSNVGGGADLNDTNDPDDLWLYSYVWMQRHAEKHGLRFYWTYESPATRQANSRTRRVSLRETDPSLKEFALGLYNKYKMVTSWWSRTSYIRKTNPKQAMLHWSVVERIKVTEANYRVEAAAAAAKEGIKPKQPYQPPSLFGKLTYDEFMATVTDEGSKEVIAGKWHIETDDVMACPEWRLWIPPKAREATKEKENGKDK